MSYNPSSYSKALDLVGQRRIKALEESVIKKQNISKICPEINRIEKELQKTGAGIAECFYSGDPQADIKKLSEKSLKLQEEKEALLTSLGYPEDYLKPHYACRICNDTGRTDGQLCECVKKLISAVELEKLEKTAPVSKCSFEQFNIDFYKGLTDENGINAEENMKRNFEYLKDYACNFRPGANNIFMFGKTGLGKTHLSLSLAKKVIEKGFYVVYGTASNILSGLEKEKFKDDASSYNSAQTEDADLLIIDDLGAEFLTSFTASALHNIIETRLLANKTTVINTNLDITGIEQKYGERIASRIIGEFEPVKFTGKDIRQIKRFQY